MFNKAMKTENAIQMVDLKGQYLKIQNEIDNAVLDCIRSGLYIMGPEVKRFEDNFADYLNVNHVIGCANGTDALQIALMALNLKPGDEVIVPAFTYVATAEVIALLGLKPIMVDVNVGDFTIMAENLERFITDKTRAIIPVHLYGQSANMEMLIQLARKYNLYIVEDNAQAIGSDYLFKDGSRKKTGTIGNIGCTSFFPSKNLGCYGDGGALITNDPILAENIRTIANHGQKKKYNHSVVGINSRLDTLQAAVLNVKLKYINNYISARREAAAIYDFNLQQVDDILIPFRSPGNTHVFHQYTIRIKSGKRDRIQEALTDNGIPSMIYYPLPLYKQQAYAPFYKGPALTNTELLCSEVLSLPIHTELNSETIEFICQVINNSI
jgi:UDP-2-acetamido-2-deoxy-ribo-hexuluronate aminotransferase